MSNRLLLRSGRLDAHLQLAESPEARSAGHLDPQRQHRLPLQRAARVEPRPARRQPVQSARRRSATSPARTRSRWASRPRRPGITRGTTTAARRPGSARASSSYTFLNNRPSQITQYAEPVTFDERLKVNLGIYVQDQWTLQPADAQPGAALRLLQRLRARAEPEPPVRSCRRAATTRSSACRAGRTSARGWRSPTMCSATASRPQGQPRPIRGGRHLHAGARQQPGHPGGAERLADLDRQQQQLRARLRSGELRMRKT